jgi:hypothetical protein
MQYLFRQPESEPQTPSRFFGILHWLAGLIQLTEEEQSAAGIYFGNRPDKNNES